MANRTRGHADRLAAAVGGDTADLAELPVAMADADLVISCTGASGLVITADLVARLLPGATPIPSGQARLVFLDLAMPRDVGADVAERPGVTVIGMDELADAGRTAIAGPGSPPMWPRSMPSWTRSSTPPVGAHAAQVTPTVVALRAKAAEVVDAELARLEGRLQNVEGFDGHALDEIARTVRRVVDKLLHAPTVRVKSWPARRGGRVRRGVAGVVRPRPADGRGGHPGGTGR